MKDSTAFSTVCNQDLSAEDRAYRLSTVLTAITSFAPDLEVDIKERELVELFIFSHHKYIGKFDATHIALATSVWY